jgi:peptidoglycan/LPS O-acetylase OafA/YrhL
MASQKHLPALDGIRGLAILIVLILHFGGGAQSSNVVVRTIGLITRGGWTGVSLFFVLSGFLISGILWDTRNTPGWWRSFYMRRTLRIFPLYYAALLLALLAAFIVGTGLQCLSKMWTFAFYLQNMPTLQKIVGDMSTPLWLAHFWSLAVEEQFYLLWPFLLTRMKTLRQARYLCLAVFLSSEIFRILVFHFAHLAIEQDLDPYKGFLPVRAGELAIGAYLAMCYRDSSWNRVQSWAPAVAMTALGVFIAASIVNHTFWLDGPIGLLIGLPSVSIFFGGLLALSLASGVTNRLATMAWLRWLGGLSYGIYVYHVLFFGLYDNLAIWTLKTFAPHASMGLVPPLKAMIGLPCSIAIAWLSFHYFEFPFLRRRTKYSQPTPV